MEVGARAQVASARQMVAQVEQATRPAHLRRAAERVRGKTEPQDRASRLGTVVRELFRRSRVEASTTAAAAAGRSTATTTLQLGAPQEQVALAAGEPG